MNAVIPTAEIKRLEYVRVGEGLKKDGCRVTFIPPSGEENTHTLSDNAYTMANNHLQLLAAIGKKPTDYDGEVMDLTDERPQIAVAFQNGEWKISQNALNRGREALKNVDWFDLSNS